METIVTIIKRLYRARPPLTATGLAMLVVFVVTLIVWSTDARTIAGAPAWLKPAKFAGSGRRFASACFSPYWDRQPAG